MKKSKPVLTNKTKWKTRTNKAGQLEMVCQNSEPGGKWWKGKECDSYTVVSANATAVLCWRCVNQHVEAPSDRLTAQKSNKPKGWKFMKVFVAQDGTVYHKGEEQPSLKGTLPVTVIQPKQDKKKLTKQEKDSAIMELGKQIKSLKSDLITETRKGKRAELTRALSKANREMKKLM